jgi:chemotaxis protein CheD
MTKIKIGPGEHYVTRQKNEAIVTVLGSCVAACIRDPIAGVGGMNHFMLPESTTGRWGGASANMRYGNFAMEVLINDILRHGGQRHRMEIKLFGGATMIASGSTIGPQNADFVEAYLKAEQMSVAAHHLRGHHARRVEYEPFDGRVRLLEMSLDRGDISQSEQRFFVSMRDKAASGSMELFD